MRTTDLRAERLDSLTGARFIAALGVFLFHAGSVFPAVGVFGTALAVVGRNGGIGVDFFFTLSGFVLAWSYRPGTRALTFYRRRFARIAPAYWVALLLGLVWVIVLYRDPARAAVAAIPAVFGVQAWFPDPAVHFAANGVEWSVSAELFFYALFPLLIVVARRRAGRNALIVLAVVVGFIAPVVLPPLVPAGSSSWVLDILPALRVGQFVCGLLLALALKEGHRIPIRPVPALLTFAIVYATLPVVPFWLPQRAIYLVAILLVIAALAQADSGSRRGTVLSRPVMVRLGEWSYCFYLVHQVTLQAMLFVCNRFVPGKAQGPVWLVVALGVSVLLAALLHRTVERPFERRLRGARRQVLVTDHEGGPTAASADVLPRAVAASASRGTPELDAVGAPTAS